MRARLPLPLLLLAALALAAPATPAAAYRGLDACPSLAPPSPRPAPSPEARSCQRALARAGHVYARELLRAKGDCLERVVRGETEPAFLETPRELCQGTRFLFDGSLGPPRDAAAAAGVQAALAGLRSELVRSCSDGALASLDACADTVDGAADCLAGDHWEHVDHLLERVYGQALPTPDPEAQRCQRVVGRASATLLAAEHRARARCLVSRRAAHAAARGGDLATLCLGAVRDGQSVAPRDPPTAAALARAAASLEARLEASCPERALASLDACSHDPRGLGACLACAHRREALLLLDAELGGAVRAAESPFLGWAALRNPVLGLEDRRLKDQAVALHEGTFTLLASQEFEDDDPKRDAKPKWIFHTRDWRRFETVPERIRPDGGGVGSPDLARVDGVWHLVFQHPDPANPANRRLFLSTSRDLRSWSPATELAPGVLPGESLIDGALAFWKGFAYLVFKWRDPQLPYFTRSRTRTLDTRWLPARRTITQQEFTFLGLGEGFSENFQLVEIDGRLRLLATARDPDGIRCPDLFTCFHEPFLYTFADGDGAQLEHWERFDHKTQLRIPYEGWNTVMHANTGYLNDWREHDGFFYLSYAGSTDSESFQGRGHGKIGLARSRDLVHWRLPGDLRD